MTNGFLSPRFFLIIVILLFVVFYAVSLNNADNFQSLKSVKTRTEGSKSMENVTPSIVELDVQTRASKLGTTKVLKFEPEPQFNFMANIQSNTSSFGICFLVRSVDFETLAAMIKVVDSTYKDNNVADVVFFHDDDYPLSADILNLRLITLRKINFVSIHNVFNRIPMAMDPYKDDPNWSKRKKWSYHNMIRFWFYDVMYVMKSLGYSYFLRLDDDSKFTNSVDDLFILLKEKNAVYIANIIFADLAEVTKGLKELTLSHVKKHNIIPMNLERFGNAFLDDTCLLYYNNFEVVSIDFFLTPPVLNFAKAVLEDGGIYRYRWGDHILRYVELSLFAKKSEVLEMDRDYHIDYCHGC